MPPPSSGPGGGSGEVTLPTVPAPGSTSTEKMLRPYCRCGVGTGGRVPAIVCGSASCSALSGPIRPEPKLSSRSPGESRLALAAGCGDVGRFEFRVALQQERHDATDLGGHRRTGGELVVVVGRRPGTRRRGVLAAPAPGLSHLSRTALRPLLHCGLSTVSELCVHCLQVPRLQDHLFADQIDQTS